MFLKNTITFLAIILISLSSNAQATLGAGFQYNADLDVRTNVKGIGLFYEQEFTSNCLRVSFNYGFPSSTNRQYMLQSFSSEDPYSSVSGREIMGLTTVGVDFKQFLMSRYNDGRLYLSVGGGFGVSPQTKEAASYDETKYFIPGGLQTDRKSYFALAKAGGGYEYSFGALKIFGEGQLNVPINLMSMSTGRDIGMYFVFQLGARFSFKQYKDAHVSTEGEFQ